MGRIVFLMSLVLLGPVRSADGEDLAPNAPIVTETSLDTGTKMMPHLVLFYAPWSGHYKNFAPVYDSLADRYNFNSRKDEVKLVKVDCDEDKALCSKHGFKFIGLKFFPDHKSEGVVYDGVRTLQELKKFINKQLNEQGELSGGGVRELSADDFQEGSLSGHYFIKFFAPWCGHCKHLAPIWEELAEEFSDDGVTIAKVDCTEHRDVCQEHEVNGYPTLLWLYNGEAKHKYEGKRTMTELEDYIIEMKSKTQTGGGILSKKSTGQAELDGPSKQITGDDFDTLHGHYFVKFFTPWCGACKHLAPTWIEIAEEFENKGVTFAELNCEENRGACAMYDVQGYPTLLWFHNGIQVGKFEGSRTPEVLGDYIRKMKGKKTFTTKDSESNILRITSATWDKSVKNKLVFVMFMSPTCGFCTRMKPDWEKLATNYAKNKKVQIGMVDCSQDDKQWCGNTHSAWGFPTIRLYKNGGLVEDYRKSRELDDLIEYMESFIKRYPAFKMKKKEKPKDEL